MARADNWTARPRPAPQGLLMHPKRNGSLVDWAGLVHGYSAAPIGPVAPFIPSRSMAWATLWANTVVVLSALFICFSSAVCFPLFPLFDKICKNPLTTGT